MIPGNRLSSKFIPGAFIHFAGFGLPFEDVEWGGVALNDPSQGIELKPWKLRYDVETGDVLIGAGDVPEAVLFNRPNISQVSLAFDRNMSPVVAFTQAGQAKMYYFDDLVNDWVFEEALLADAIDPRVTHDDKRTSQNAISDVIVAYSRGGILRYRQQRDRYTVEYTPPIGPGGSPLACARLYYAGMNEHQRLQFAYKGPGMPAPPFLADVVQDLCVRSGIPPERIDVRELYGDIVHGLPVDSDDGLADPIDQLRKVFFFDKAEYDGKIHFPKRGREVVARIPYTDLVRGNPTSLKQERKDEAELAREININHLDPDGGFAKNKQYAQRRSNLINAEAKKNIDTRVVMTVDQAATAAETLLRIDWNELVEYKFATTIKWSRLTVGDIVEVEDRLGTWHRMRLEERNEDGAIEWEGVQDAGARTYGSSRTGIAVPPPASTTPGLVGSTHLEIIDISPLRDQDDELGIYVAAAGTPGASWVGYNLYVSLDGGQSYGEVYRSEQASVIGESVTELPAEPGHDIVSTETVEVTTNFPLVSMTPSQIATGGNRCVIGGEVFQFETATQLGMVGQLYHYELSGLRRAKYGTEALLWPAGARFVVLDDSVAFIRAERNMIGLDLDYKAVSIGHTQDETPATVYLFDEPASQTEWIPDNVQAVRDAGTDDVEVTWDGRPRLGQFGTPYHSKYFRGYRVRFSDDHVIDTQSETATYPNAPAGVTVTVCGLNEITGEGPASAPVAT